MKAVIFREYGGPDVLRYETVPDPVAQPGEVVVDIRAASVNAADCRMRQGGYGPPQRNALFEGPQPHILGRDFSGVVSAVGPGARGFNIGDPVFGVLDRGIEGAYAEKVAISAEIIARKPGWLSHAEAAAVALTGLTAIWALEDEAALKPGETILIQGGAGGVAGFAVQLAHHLGAKVITTASAANHEYLRSLSADHVIDYNKEDFTKVSGPCDVVFDTVGGDVQVKSYEVLKTGGRLVYIAAPPDGFKPSRTDVKLLRPAVTRDCAHLEKILEYLKQKAVAPPPIQLFKLEDAAKAHRISESRHLRGKLILEVA